MSEFSDKTSMDRFDLEDDGTVNETERFHDERVDEFHDACSSQESTESTNLNERGDDHFHDVDSDHLTRSEENKVDEMELRKKSEEGMTEEVLEVCFVRLFSDCCLIGTQIIFPCHQGARQCCIQRS